MNYNDKLREALIEQHKLWFDYDKKTLKREYSVFINCPTCDSNEYTNIFEKDWFTFSKCNRCSMVYLNPMLNEDATYSFYNSKWTAIYNEKKFHSSNTGTTIDDKENLFNLSLIERYKKNRSKINNILELGCGKGSFLRAANEKNYNVFGVELNKYNFSKLRKEFGKNIYNTDLLKLNFDSNMFDVIHMRDVFEHVPNPKQLLLELNRISKHNSIICIGVPNIEGLIYRYVKEKHVCVFGFEHLNYWSPDSLKKILNLTGYSVLETIHGSSDFTIGSLLGYFFGQLPFTSIRQRKMQFIRHLILRSILVLFKLQPLKYINKVLLPKIANKLERGSYITVIAKKR